MIKVYEKFVKKNIPEEHIGEHPGFFASIINSEANKDYRKKVSEVAEELSQFRYTNDLIPHLTSNYGLSEKEARKFVNDNVTYRWKRAKGEEKLEMMLSLNEEIDAFTID